MLTGRDVISRRIGSTKATLRFSGSEVDNLKANWLLYDQNSFNKDVLRIQRIIELEEW